MKMCFQGDVFLRAVKKIPETAKPVKIVGDVILAHGEQTGHAHRIRNGAVMLREDGTGGGTYIHVAATGASVTHEEHAKIALPAGLYEVVIQSQYTPEAIRNVAD